MTSYLERLKSLSFPRKRGQVERKVVRNEDDGSVAGYHDVHWDGSQDAHVTPKTVTVRIETQEENKQ
jgi:hypothetical protein